MKSRGLSVSNNTIKYAIGDVHGCAQEFEELVQMCHEDAQASFGKAEIWQLGDLIDRGPDVDAVFDVVERHDINTLVGNHEARFIAEHLAGQQCNSRARAQTHERFAQLTKVRQDRILDIICSESKTHYSFIDDKGTMFFMAHSLPKSVAIGKEFNAGAMTHASRSEPFTPIERQLALRWVRHHYDLHIQKLVIIHGHLHWSHIPVLEQLDDDYCRHDDVSVVNIDSGCVYGGSLTALRLDSMNTLQVQSSYTFEQ